MCPKNWTTLKKTLKIHFDLNFDNHLLVLVINIYKPQIQHTNICWLQFIRCEEVLAFLYFKLQ